MSNSMVNLVREYLNKLRQIPFVSVDTRYSDDYLQVQVEQDSGSQAGSWRSSLSNERVHSEMVHPRIMRYISLRTQIEKILQDPGVVTEPQQLYACRIDSILSSPPNSVGRENARLEPKSRKQGVSIVQQRISHQVKENWLVFTMLTLTWSRSRSEEPIFKLKIYQVFFFLQHTYYSWTIPGKDSLQDLKQEHMQNLSLVSTTLLPGQFCFTSFHIPLLFHRLLQIIPADVKS